MTRLVVCLLILRARMRPPPASRCGFACNYPGTSVSLSYLNVDVIDIWHLLMHLLQDLESHGYVVACGYHRGTVAYGYRSTEPHRSKPLPITDYTAAQFCKLHTTDAKHVPHLRCCKCGRPIWFVLDTTQRCCHRAICV